MQSPISRAKSIAAYAALALAACGGTEPRAPARDVAAPMLALLSSPVGAGAERVRAGDLVGARASFEADLAKDPDRLGALNDLAVSYFLEGHADAARRLLDDVVAKGDLGAQQAALVNLGELYAAEGYVSAAQAYLETARILDPARAEPWYALSLLADSRGDVDRARDSLAEALARDPKGTARASFAYLYPEERVHLEALVVETSGDVARAAERWRELAAGRLPALAAAAERHLAGE